MIPDSVINEISKLKFNILGINGGVGTGKSTLARKLSDKLNVDYFSIDDFYRSLNYRKKLNCSGNFYYSIPRGIFGTHRTKLLRSVLKKLSLGETVKVPIFDKSLNSGWGGISGYKEIKSPVIFEGWCIGCMQGKIFSGDAKLINYKIKTYVDLWSYCDKLVSIQPDNLDYMYKWRLKQEHTRNKKSLNDKQVKKLVDVFYPWVELTYETCKPDIICKLDDKQLFRLN